MQDKFFYEKSKDRPYTNRSWANVIRFNKTLVVNVDENVEYSQSISIDIDKLNTQEFIVPQSESYQIVKPIIKENFYEYYYLALKYITEIDHSEGEFYLCKKYSTDYTITWFNTDDKNRKSIEVTVINSIETFDIRINASKKWKDRPAAHKNGKAISLELYGSLFKSIIRFLYDPENLELNAPEFVTTYINSLKNDTVPVLVPSHIEKSIHTICKTIEIRLDSLEKRLIESDTDTPEERNRIRGEVEGLKFSLKVILNA